MQLWGAKNCLADMNPWDGKYIATCLVFRGNMLSSVINENESSIENTESDINLRMEELNNEIYKTQNKMSNDFIKYIPNNFKSMILNVNQHLLYNHETNQNTNHKNKISDSQNNMIRGTLISNTTAVSSVFKRILDIFDRMFKRKAFLHGWVGCYAMYSLSFLDLLFLFYFWF